MELRFAHLNYSQRIPSRFPCCVLSYFSLVFVMEHSRRWWLHIGGSKMFEPLFQAGLSFPSHFFLQNIRVWYIKIEFQGSFFGMECRLGGWEAIFAADQALAPHIEDDPRNEEQHCKQPNFPPTETVNAWPSPIWWWWIFNVIWADVCITSALEATFLSLLVKIACTKTREAVFLSTMI